MKKDKIHYNGRLLDSYNLVWNFVISEREAGKSTWIWSKAFKKFKHDHQTTLVCRRIINDITDTYINDIQKVINKFLPEEKKVKFEYKKGNLKEGIADVYIGSELFIRIIALSNPMSRIKSLMVENPAMIIFDEFICNNKMGEKYVENEAFKFKEIYNTYQRECDGYTLKCYFCGNPYSLYNPYFADFDVDTSKLKPGAFIVNRKRGYVIECYQLTEELRQFILSRNPLYQFDDSYKRYAFNGLAVNDEQYEIVKKKPENYNLRHVFRIAGKYVYVYSRSYRGTGNILPIDYHKFWIYVGNEYSGKKKIYAIDFNNLVSNTRLVNQDAKVCCRQLKHAIGRRDVTYSSVEAAYLAEELYQAIK